MYIILVIYIPSDIFLISFLPELILSVTTWIHTAANSVSFHLFRTNSVNFLFSKKFLFNSRPIDSVAVL